LCTRSMNLSCFGVDFFEVLMFSPFVPNTVMHGSCCLACGAGCFSPNAKPVPEQVFRPPEEKRGSQSLSGLDWRVGAEESLGHGSGYRSALLMSLVVKFTYQVGKKFPSEDLHPYDSGLMTDSTEASDYVAYTCRWTGSRWKCGCRDSACTQSYWQIQSFKR
jgi:hypothetical protein